MGGKMTADIHARAKDAFGIYLFGIERGLTPNRDYLVGEGITLADICFVAEIALFSNEKAQQKLLADNGLNLIFHADAEAEYPRALAHFTKLSQHEAFAPDVQPYMEKLRKRIERQSA
jgi:elongation factor 1-gamma